MIRLQQLNKVYHMDTLEVPVLKDVNIEIDKGEFTAIMGPSGSGKSTLMNIIGLLDNATSGSYYFNDEEMNGLPDKQLTHKRNRHIGFVFQQFHLLPRMNALQNVELPLIYAGVSSKIRSIKANLALERVGLGDRKHHLPNQLSGGQQQRVAIARALVTEPQLILADEPTGSLDTSSGRNILSLLQRLNEEGKTIILVTHDQETAQYCGRHIIIRDGCVVSDRRVEAWGYGKD
ncbi:ABC transporter ATP-binding protein [Paenibacillus chartarius]|uniref:ABC transporter ATP-binding protein n=1 Tax=Paenibacillus chartarius TaxID=747481 RepID=A0ABV6DLM1_9BACL